MQIVADRIYLRELTGDDCSDAYVAWLADPEVNRFLETRYAVQDIASIRAFVERISASPDEFLFGIFFRNEDRHVGNIKVGPINRRHELADVSLFVGDRAAWGRGIATEAIGAASRHAFGRLGIAKLSASMYEPNEGSRRAFLKAGYRDEGLRRLHYVFEGERCDLREMGLVAPKVDG